MLAQPSLWVFAAMVAGILGADVWQPPAQACAWATALGSGLLVVTVCYRRGTVMVALLVVASAGAWATSQVGYPAPTPAPCTPEGGLWQVQIDAPIDRRVDGGELHLQTAARVLAERCGDRWQPRQGHVRLVLRGTSAVARGDRLALRLRLSDPPVQHHAFELPGAERLRRQGFTSQAEVLSGHVRLAPGTGILAHIDRARTRGAEAFEAGLSPPHAALAKALALGDTAALTPAQRDAWAAAGIAHLLSVSGLHVAMVALMMSGIVRYGLAFLPGAGDRFSLRGLAAWCALPCLLGFCILTGAHPAAMRATIMAGGALLGAALGYPSAIANAWGVAGSVMLMADPMALYDVGFILSFAAVGALVWLVRPDAAPTSTDASVAPGHWRRRVNAWGRQLRASWRVSLAATCVTAPITAYVFNRVCWVAPAVNLLAVPIGSTFATPWALMTAVVAPCHPWLQRLMMQPLGWGLGALDGIAATVGSLRWASIDVAPPTWCELGAYAALVAACYEGLLRQRRALILGAAASLMLMCSVGWRVVQRQGDNNLWVRHVYVGQGDATLITLPQGGIVLIDGGGSVRDMGPDPGRIAVAPTLRRLGVHRIDWMVLTHPHPDHINGLLHIAASWQVRHLLLGGGGVDYGSVQALQKLVRKSGGQVVRLQDSPERMTWEGVDVALLHPRAPGSRAAARGSDANARCEDAYANWHLNDNSVVLRLQWGARSMLLAGDIEKRAEQVLVGLGVTADILKVGHHGSRTSSTLAFLHSLHPHTAVISCGYRNHFGFPHIETLERLSIVGTRILRTDAEGTIAWRTDGTHWYVRSVQHPEEIRLDG